MTPIPCPELEVYPFADDEVELWLNGRRERTARELIMNQPRQGPEPKPAESPGRSRYLDVLEQKAKERRKKKLGAISFHGLGGGGNV